MAAKKPLVNSAGRVNLGVSALSEVEFSNLIEAQIRSFEWFLEKGFRILFDEINPVKDSMERMWAISFGELRYGTPNRSIEEAINKGLSYDAPLYVTIQLLNAKTGEIKQQDVFVADMPVMTVDGYFVINGVRRVVTHQIVRSEGVLFDMLEKFPGRILYGAKLIPHLGQWYDFDVNRHDVISLRLVNKRPKVLITELLRVLGYETDDEIRALFAEVDTNEEHKYIEATLARDFTRNKAEAIMHVFNKIRPDENVSLDTAEKYIKGLFFNNKKFDIGKVGRYQLNRKLGTNYSLDGEDCKFYVEDIIAIVRKLIRINNGVELPDDVDSLLNRRIRSVGEILVDQLRPAVRRLEKSIRDKMSMFGEDSKLTPSMLVSTKPLAAAIQTFFGQSQLSKFMDQANILSELEEKRRVTASGPGGLNKDRASFSVREVHQSHYSRVDPITSPESSSIGVVTQLALFARVNEFGYLEAPYRKIVNSVKNDGKSALNRIAADTVKDGKTVIVEKNAQMGAKEVAALEKVKGLDEIKVNPFVTKDVEYLDALQEAQTVVTVSTIKMDDFGNILDNLIPVRKNNDFLMAEAQEVSYVDIIPAQQAGIGMSLIPFIAHDDTKRALTGSNQQRQAVPLLKPEAPLVGTGLEDIVARQTGWGLFAEEDGVVEYVDAKEIMIKYKNLGPKTYKIVKFERSNFDTAFTQRPCVNKGDKVKKGDLLVDGPSMNKGELAIGTNIRCALMFFDGYNYEDAVIISDRIIKTDKLTSVHVKEYEINLRETDIGPEVLTADIPHVSEAVLAKLDERGVVRIGASVGSGDILVGVVAPRGQRELTAEQRLLRAIFGESASDVKDSSLRVPHGSKGVVIRTQLLSVENGDKLQPGALAQIKVWVAETKKMGYGDKLSGRHGDKNTVAAIRPVEDMPFTADGEHVDIILTPTFVKRMNMGQAKEVHYGRYADLLGTTFAFPLFEDVNDEWIKEELEKNGYEMSEKVDLWDGRTGEKFPRKIAVGMKYVLKLKHIADEKMHARSIGPYTLVTQQPLGGKAQFGGQRFGEMEVWALEAHGAAYALQEMLTIKSDDVKGRAQAYKAIIHGEKIENVNVPESFKVLVRELNALCLNLDLISNNNEEEYVEEEPKEEL